MIHFEFNDVKLFHKAKKNVVESKLINCIYFYTFFTSFKSKIKNLHFILH